VHTVAPLPAPRGPLSEALLEALVGARPTDGLPVPATDEDPYGDDLQLALHLAYELHYRGLPGVDERWEWQPSLVALVGALEERVAAALEELVDVPDVTPAEVPAALTALVDGDDSPSVAAYLHRTATLGQFREFVAHRSIDHLKEADAHAWGIPRLAGSAKAALVEIQTDEYGNGRPERMHSTLFANTMRALDLDPA